ncbi:hypothetical protein D3C76_1443000 [compost metagenome]
MRLDQASQGILRNLARGGDARHLVQRGLRRQLRIEAAGGSGDQRQRDRRAANLLGLHMVGDAFGERRIAGRQVAGGAGHGGVVAGRGARVEPFGAIEFLRDQGGAADFAMRVADQAAVGLPGKGELGDGGDGQRVGDAGDQAQQDEAG